MDQIGSKPPFDFKEGALLLFNKPIGWTSFDVVNKVRYGIKKHLQVKKIKVGHSGTLDPLATGLLIICTGRFTKRLNELQGLPKTYTGCITLGGTTPSYDLETEVNETFSTDHIDEALLEQARQSFLGPIEQVPPMYSAIKVDGEALYKKARKGIELKLKKRPVEIYRFDLSQNEMPKISFEVDCSKGTYIRSLAYDFGQAVKSGGHLSELCRTRVGAFKLEDAWTIEAFIAHLDSLPPPPPAQQ